MIKSYTFKIRRPSKAIVQKFEQTLELCRELYNAGLQERRDAWDLNRISISYYKQQDQLPEIKTIRDDLNSVYSQVLQDALRRLDNAFKRFFLRVQKNEKPGFPRFKGKNNYNSFCYPQAGKSFQLDGNNLTLTKIGKLKLHLSQKMIGKAKTCTITRKTSGWFVIFTVETEEEILPKTGKKIGIDAGIENFLTLSDGTQIENLKYFESSQKQLRRAQRKVSRRKKGSNGRKNAVLQLRKIHQKIKNQRNDHAHKVSTQLVKVYDLIAIENLNILGMSKGILSKQVHDVAWYNFFYKLKYKAENAGRLVIEVNPGGTSQTCLCGKIEKKTLSQRWHNCKKCGLSIHRDELAAKIILKRAVGQSAKDITYAAG